MKVGKINLKIYCIPKVMNLNSENYRFKKNQGLYKNLYLNLRMTKTKNINLMKIIFLADENILNVKLGM